MMDGRRQTGRKGEDEACAYLVGIGQSVVARNWRSGHLEIDIVTLDGNGLHIVEVKTRREPAYVDPSANFTEAKKKALVRAALAFLHSGAKKVAGSDVEIFFDAVTVVFGSGGTKIEYYPQVFIPLYV